jgi:HlyD family secretion protein
MDLLAPSPGPLRVDGELTAVPRPPHRSRRLVLLVLAVIVVAAVAAAIIILERNRQKILYQTVPAAHRRLVQSVTATGTVNPQDTITVGSQVSGTIKELHADYNSHVRRGQILARIDPTSFQAAVDQARGALAQSQAQLAASLRTLDAASASANGALATARAGEASASSARETARAQRIAIAAADAEVTRTASALALARTTLDRDRQLLARGYVPRSQYDNDASALAAASAADASARVSARQVRAQAAASVSGAAASAAQRDAQRFAGVTAAEQRANAAALVAAQRGLIETQRAQLAQAEYNLSRTVILSPVDGTVVARNVSVGQTVAASFQTPTLFTIARDLRKMEVDVAVGEPDVGGVHAGQIARFTVLAYPTRTFQGKIAMVRQNPTTVQNVVTYTTVAYVDNGEALLRPGMTANAKIDVARADDGMVVPLQALTYVMPAENGAKPNTGRSGSPGSIWGATATSGTNGVSVVAGTRTQLYLLERGKPVAIPVRVLLVAGTDASVASEGPPIPDGAPIVVADSTVTARAASATTPFNPALRTVR